jgi:sortase A
VLLSLVALGATWISRRTSRNLVGALVGVVPFVVVLYFFFENLNRLMPPSL